MQVFSIGQPDLFNPFSGQNMRPGAMPSARSGAGGGAAKEDGTDDPAAQGQVNRLKQREGEVRRHEQAHISAGGPYVQGGAKYSYQQGPDGRQYIAGGEVSIDVSPVSGNPAATIEKMQTVRKAAMAPADPSPQDRAVAAKASQMETQARAELLNQNSAQGGIKTHWMPAPGLKTLRFRDTSSLLKRDPGPD